MPSNPRPRRRRFSAARRDRMAKALELRQAGVPYRRIAHTLNISPTQAYDDVMDALQEITREPAETVIDQELDRLDRLFHVAYAKATSEKDLKAVQAALNVMERRAKYLGLDNRMSEDDTRAVQAGIERLLEGPTTP